MSPEAKQVFRTTKRAVAQAQTLRVVDPTLPFLLTVQVEDCGFGWGLWPKLCTRKTPIGFWSQLWKGAEEQYSLVENQLAVMYAALLTCESIMGPHPVTVQTTYQMGGWLWS